MLKIPSGMPGKVAYGIASEKQADSLNPHAAATASGIEARERMPPTETAAKGNPMSILSIKSVQWIDGTVFHAATYRPRSDDMRTVATKITKVAKQ